MWLLLGQSILATHITGAERQMESSGQVTDPLQQWTASRPKTRAQRECRVLRAVTEWQGVTHLVWWLPKDLLITNHPVPDRRWAKASR